MHDTVHPYYRAIRTLDIIKKVTIKPYSLLNETNLSATLKFINQTFDPSISMGSTCWFVFFGRELTYDGLDNATLSLVNPQPDWERSLFVIMRTSFEASNIIFLDSAGWDSSSILTTVKTN